MSRKEIIQRLKNAIIDPKGLLYGSDEGEDIGALIMLLESEPGAGEFIKELRASILEQNGGLVAVENDLIYVPAKIALEACDRIDRLEADLKAVQSRAEAAENDWQICEEELKAKDVEIEKICDFIRNEGKVNKWKILNRLEQALKGGDK